MNKLFSYKKVVVYSALASLLLSVTALAATLPGRGSYPTGNATSPKPRLQDVKLKACQARENAIKNRSTHLADMAKNMEDKFGSIAKRVEDYYQNTVVPSGKTVADYDALVADIQTKKTAVETALTKAQNDFAGFSCASGDPKGAMAQFRKDMQSVKQVLKDYRMSIKNLIAAVHSVTGKENKENTNIPTPANQGGSAR